MPYNRLTRIHVATFVFMHNTFAHASDRTHDSKASGLANAFCTPKVWIFNEQISDLSIFPSSASSLFFANSSGEPTFPRTTEFWIVKIVFRFFFPFSCNRKNSQARNPVLSRRPYASEVDRWSSLPYSVRSTRTIPSIFSPNGRTRNNSLPSVSCLPF